MKRLVGILPVLIFALGLAASVKLFSVGIDFVKDKDPVFHLASVQPAPGTQLAQASTQPRDDVEPPVVPAGETDRRILEQLAARRAELDAREASLDAREDLIGAAQERLRISLDGIKQEQAELIALQTEREAASDDEISALISAYERMKARDAGTIFDDLDETILVPVAAGMRTQALAGVLAEMQPANARRLTIFLADRAGSPDKPPAGQDQLQ